MLGTRLVSRNEGAEVWKISYAVREWVVLGFVPLGTEAPRKNVKALVNCDSLPQVPYYPSHDQHLQLC